jgi:uncharacterized membrane protein YbhN (UPF0104 family)
VIVLPLALIGTIYLFKDQISLVLILSAVILIIGVITILFYNRISSFIKKYILRKYAVYFKNFTVNIKYTLTERKSYLFLNIFFTVLKQLNATFSFFMIFLALGGYISPAIIFSASSIEGVASQIPISLSGLGLSEGTAIVLYHQVGIAAYFILSAYLFNRLYGYAFAGILYLIKIIISFKKN